MRSDDEVPTATRIRRDQRKIKALKTAVSAEYEDLIVLIANFSKGLPGLALRLLNLRLSAVRCMQGLYQRYINAYRRREKMLEGKGNKASDRPSQWQPSLSDIFGDLFYEVEKASQAGHSTVSVISNDSADDFAESQPHKRQSQAVASAKGPSGGTYMSGDEKAALVALSPLLYSPVFMSCNS